ncbi:hypothetical protein niasHT_029909 [Heterodera trifolii]|uniref:BTB domain-containing protein n=1 Tax=Heterodera trifolii TaxID=157864 RepID=A0ABD2KCF6_9BILA
MKFFVILISFLLFGEAFGGGSSSKENNKSNDRHKTNALTQRIGKLLNTGAYGDVQFVVEEGDKKELLLAHKAILSHGSEEMALILAFDTENSSDSNGEKSAESIKTVLVTDVPIEAFKVMLSFIYTEDLKGLTAQNLLDVLFAAKKYKIIGLINACVAFPVSRFSNVFEVIIKARLLDMDLAQCCLQYIDQNSHDLFLSENFLQIDNDFLTELLSRDQLQANRELEIWEAALRWADAQCRRNGTECSAKNRRAALGQALFEIRFPLIKKENFSLIIVPSGVLTSEEVNSVYQFDPNEFWFNRKNISKFRIGKRTGKQQKEKRTYHDSLEALFRFEASKMDNAAEKTSDQSIAITNMSISSFNVLLQFIYADDFSGLNGENWAEVINAAKMYEISGLVEACEIFPISKLPNVFEAVELARLLDLEEFAKRCLDYIDANAETLLRTNEFLQIDKQILCEVFGRENLQINGEFSLWNAALRWADAQCRQNGKECSAPSGVLTQKEVESIYQFHAHPELIGAPGGLPPLQFPAFPSREKAHRNNSGGTLRLEIGKFSEFAQGPIGTERLGEHMFIRGIPLQILAKVSSGNYLGLFIKIKAPVAQGEWTLKCSSTFRILSQKSTTKGATNFKCMSFINYLTDDGLYYKKADKLNLEIDVNCDE